METNLQNPDLVWQQVTIEFADYTTAEDTTAMFLRPVLDSAAAADQIASWSFLRKAPRWRLRYLSRPDTAPLARSHVEQALSTLQEAERVNGWASTIYEPEIHAFGGPDAMALAHQLFHRDSQHILTSTRVRKQRPELTILLCCVLLRGAGQDWYEQGDVWARVAEHRAIPSTARAGDERTWHAGLRRLMTVDADPSGPLAGAGGRLADIASWIDAFHAAGAGLGDLARAGTLRRGLRAVLTHHVIFHWNRIGLSVAAQYTLAHAAQAVILEDSGRSPAPCRSGSCAVEARPRSSEQLTSMHDHVA